MSDYNRSYFPLRVLSEGERGSLRSLREQEEKINTDAAMHIKQKKSICVCVSLMPRASVSGLVQRHVSRFGFFSLRPDLRHTFDRSFGRIHYSQRFVIRSLNEAISGMILLSSLFSLCFCSPRLSLSPSCTRHARGRPRDVDVVPRRVSSRECK